MKPISKTAYYTAGIRMLDAQLPRPICNDHLAHVFMNEEGNAILNETRQYPGARISNVQRHQIIDALLTKELEKNSRQKIILIGAGLDTRAFRLQGGNWLEVDEPEMITYKESKLPQANCPNPLQRMAVNFGAEKVEERLQEFKTEEQVVIVMEGVFMYLNENQITTHLKAIETLFPNHTLICDLLTKRFFNFFSRKLHSKLSGLGANFNFMPKNPQGIFLQNGYTQQEKISIVQTAIDKGNIKIPFVPWLFMKNTLRWGYTINVLEKKSG